MNHGIAGAIDELLFDPVPLVICACYCLWVCAVLRDLRNIRIARQTQQIEPPQDPRRLNQLWVLKGDGTTSELGGLSVRVLP
jgi:hypothetical protein